MSHNIGTGLIAGEIAHHQGVGKGGSLGTGLVASEIAQHSNLGTIGKLGTGVGTGLIASEFSNHQNQGTGYQGTNYQSTGYQGTGYQGTSYEGGYGAHQLQHGAGLGGIGSGMTTVSSNVSTNPNYLNETGLASTGIATTTGGYAGNFNQHQTGLNTGMGTGVGQSTLVNTGYGTNTSSEFSSGLQSGTGTAYNTIGTGIGQSTLVGTGLAPEVGHHHHHHHHHNDYNQGTSYQSTGYQGTSYEGGYGTHQLQHGAGLGGIGSGITTASSNVSANPNYLNETGLASTGIATTTGGFVGTGLSNQLDKGFANQQQFGTGFNSGLGTVNQLDKGLVSQQQFGTGLNSGLSTGLNSGTTFVQEPHLSTMDKIKAKLHM